MPTVNLLTLANEKYIWRSREFLFEDLPIDTTFDIYTQCNNNQDKKRTLEYVWTSSYQINVRENRRKNQDTERRPTK